MADTVKSTADTISNGFLPYLSAAAPAIIAPTKHPTRAVVMATPCIKGDSLMLKYNGGGHKAVGTCQFSNENMDSELPKMLNELCMLANE